MSRESSGSLAKTGGRGGKAAFLASFTIPAIFVVGFLFLLN